MKITMMNSIENLDISNTGHYGIQIVNRMSGAQDYYHRNIVIKDSKFNNTGGSGVLADEMY